MSGLLEDIRAESTIVNNRCIIHRVAEKLDEKDRADLMAALEDDSINARAIARALIKRGFDLNPNGERVRIHRRRQCGCARG